MIIEPTFPGSSFNIPITIRNGSTPLTFSYAPGAIMNNPAAGYGICWVTVFIAGTTTIAKDSLGMPIQNIYCICTNPTGLKEQATINIREGLMDPGNYSAQPYYGVNLAGGTIDWRKQAAVAITVAPLVGSTDAPVA